MLRISPEQMTALSASAEAGFARRVENFLRDHFDDAAHQSLADLRAEIEAGVDNGKRYGLETEQEVMSFILAAHVLGPGFDKHAGVRAYLSSDRPSLQKAMFLDAIVLETDRMAQDAGISGS